ncbi:hypothetical protein OF83DRAFT_920628 [Amylostereum chailletii]|nr:hypothetical protein OF83DRAFT_920628 [Amylostereum chailletii]
MIFPASGQSAHFIHSLTSWCSLLLHYTVLSPMHALRWQYCCSTGSEVQAPSAQASGFRSRDFRSGLNVQRSTLIDPMDETHGPTRLYLTPTDLGIVSFREYAAIPLSRHERTGVFLS